MPQKRGFIRDEKTGGYKVRGHVTEDEIVKQAGELLYQDLESREEITSPKDAGHLFQLRLGGSKTERFAVLFLSNRHTVNAYEELFQGTVDAATIHVRVVVQRALELNAAALVIAHCHPSGELSSSNADRAVTQRLKDALGLVDVRLLDHIICGSNGWASMAERGEL